MDTDERKQKLLKELYDAVVEGDENIAKKTCESFLEEGFEAYDAMSQGLTKAMDRVGELYATQEYFVPELLMCADALYAGLDVLRPHIKVDRAEKQRQIIMGTVEGDIHDIGKNLVKIMFEAAGWLVHDLGKDVKLTRFVEEQKKTKSDIVALSALMTTSMLAIPKAIEMIRAEDPHVAIMVGGAPLTRDTATRYGADGYANTAGEAVHEANEMLMRMNK